MRQLLLFIIPFLLLSLYSVAQDSIDSNVPNVIWEKTYGGEREEYIYDLMPTADGGYIMAGHTDSKGSGKTDIWLFKTDSEGEMEWDKTIGGIEDEHVKDIERTDDAGYMLLGNTKSKGAGNSDIWLIKVDEKGDMEWNKTFGGIKAESASSLIRLKDKTYIICGTKMESTKLIVNGAPKFSLNYYIWLINVDRDGNEVWNRTIASENMVNVADIKEGTNGDLYLVANTKFKKSKSEDGWLICTDMNGQVKWKRAVGSKTNAEIAHSLELLDDGSMIIAGLVMPKGSVFESDAWLTKVNRKGKIQWQKTFGAKGTDEVYSLIKSDEGGYLLAGSYGSSRPEDGSMWVIKTDLEGNIKWERTCGEGVFEKAAEVIETFSGEIVIVGNSTTQLLPNADGTMPSWEEGKKKYGDLRLVKLGFY